MELLGRTYNIIPTADAVWVNLRDVKEVSFVGVGADTFTVQSSATASGGGTNLAVVDHSYQNANANGSTAFTIVTQAAGAAVVSTAAVTVIEIHDAMLPDGHKYVRCSSTSTALVVAIAGDLVVQRKPANLAALGV